VLIVGILARGTVGFLQLGDRLRVLLGIEILVRVLDDVALLGAVLMVSGLF
jgi:hypothetical protein